MKKGGFHALPAPEIYTSEYFRVRSSWTTRNDHLRSFNQNQHHSKHAGKYKHKRSFHNVPRSVSLSWQINECDPLDKVGQIRLQSVQQNKDRKWLIGSIMHLRIKSRWTSHLLKYTNSVALKQIHTVNLKNESPWQNEGVIRNQDVRGWMTAGGIHLVGRLVVQFHPFHDIKAGYEPLQ